MKKPNITKIQMNKEQTIKNDPFKICTICQTVWKTRADFLEDQDIIIVGYQTHFEELTEGLFLFNHSCKGTLSVNAKLFADLYNGPVFKEKLTGTKECPGYCLHENNLNPCPAHCECAFVREIIQIIKNRKK